MFVFYKIVNNFDYQGPLFNDSLPVDSTFLCEIPQQFQETVKMDDQPSCTGDLLITYFKFIRYEEVTGNCFIFLLSNQLC